MLPSFGSNKPKEKPPLTFFELVWEALEDTTLRILIGAAVISLIVGMIENPADGWLEGTAILCAVVIVVMVTATNDYIKDKQFRKLSAKADEVSVTVVRDGGDTEKMGYELVVGDIVKIKTGCIVPADGIVLEAFMMKADESSKTGESKLLVKAPFLNEDTPRTSPFLLSGSKLEEGGGVMVVTAVGVNSSTGQTAELLEEESEETPLEQKLEKIADWIGTIGFYVALFTFIVLVGYLIVDAFKKSAWDGESWHGLITSFIIAVTIIVVAVPEGLPLAVTLSLAYSVGKMRKEQNLVRRLQACETMGGATDVCTDKTGTLTQNRMAVTDFYVNGKDYKELEFAEAKDQPFFGLLINSFCLNSDAGLVPATEKGGLDEQKGNRTECALIGLAKRWGVDYEQVRNDYKIITRVPFDSKWKWMATLVDLPEGRTVLVKGASENIIDLCSYKYTPDGPESLTPEEKEELNKVVTKHAQNSRRTIALAYRTDPSLEAERFFKDVEDEQGIQTVCDSEYITEELVFLGIMAIQDPLRPEVTGAVHQVQRAGVRVRMVTGDNIETAMSIAKECGILDKNFVRKEGDYTVMEGSEFAKLVGGLKDDVEKGVKIVGDLSAFKKVAQQLCVLARSAPEHKFILVTGLKQMDKVVAVTGDGSNDAPALKKADVGFAMNIAGTQLAKDAAAIILIDDNFASIVTALKWGRNIYDCIRKFIQFQLTVNITALSLCFVGAVFLHQAPLTAVQMLWVNLIMDTFAALALATEPPSNKLLKRRPYGRKDSMINEEMKRHILTSALYQVTWLLVILFLAPTVLNMEPGWSNKGLWTQESGRHFTFFFNAFVAMQVFNEINCRKLKASEWNVFKGFFNNGLFLFILVLTVAVQVLIVQYGGAIMSCSQLTLEEHLYCLGIGAGSLVYCLLVKVLPAKVCTCWKLDEDKPHVMRGLQSILRRDTTKGRRGAAQAFGKALRLKTR